MAGRQTALGKVLADLQKDIDGKTAIRHALSNGATVESITAEIEALNATYDRIEKFDKPNGAAKPARVRKVKTKKNDTGD